MTKTGLPSKQFLIRGGIATGVVAIILVVQTNWFQGLFHRKGTLTADNLTVGHAVAQDSNGNGIPDWEERLWGLDPTELYTGDMSNREIIENKKKALGLTPDSNEPLTESDRLARQLFSISTALGQEGADNASISNAASALGGAVEVKVATDRYFFKDLHTVTTTANSLRAYQKASDVIFSKYDTDTADIMVVINAMESGDFSQLPQLKTSAAIYRSLGKEMSAMSVPLGVAQYHLDIINGFEGMATGFDYLTQLEEDGISGLNGIAIYQQYSLRFDTALYDINEYLIQYGIL